MSLLKRRPLTPGRLEANRRKAQKSTGHSTAQGKTQLSLNRQEDGGFSEDMTKYPT